MHADQRCGLVATVTANGDVKALILMANLADEIDTAIAEAVKRLCAFGFSWAEIGARPGVTRHR